MLTHLHIRHYAVVEELELEISDGLTVLTGETGAGKSLLVDALGIILGDRSDSSVVRAGADRAQLTASFDIQRCHEAREWLQKQDLESEDECLVTRSITADGRSRGWINGRPATITNLRELGECLADIHHQHAHQSLLKSATQRMLLDEFAGDTKLVQKVRALYNEWQQVNAKMTELQGLGGDHRDRLELLQYQFDELTALDLNVAELAELDTDHKRLSNARELLDSVNKILNAISGDEPSAESSVDHALSNLRPAAELDSQLAPTIELLDSAQISLNEASSELQHYLDTLQLDPERLAEIEQRISIIHDLARKHHLRPQQLPQRMLDLEQELGNLKHADQHLLELRQQEEQLLANYKKTADRLSKLRKKSAKELAIRIIENLNTLGMERASFEVAIESLTETTPRPTGMDRIEFQVTMNPGQPLQPLTRVASGGELSRISLAIQVIAAADGGTPTLIFDEVDVGIGGATAETVGQLLRVLGEKRQVLCITHLPQVASQGHQHLRVNKLSTDSTAHTHITLLNDDERVEEISRMLGGQKITTKTREHAREMIGSVAQSRVTEEA